MAFLNDDNEGGDSLYAEAQRKAEVFASVAEERDRIVELHKETPMKIMVAFGIGSWLIYRFLIKRP